MRLVKVSLERKEHLVGITGCEYSWPCFGKPAIIFHDRGKIFTSERARQVLVDRLQIITEQAPPRTRHQQKERSNRSFGGRQNGLKRDFRARRTASTMPKQRRKQEA